MSDFKELKVWQKAHSLALSVNRVANGIRETTYSSLRSQTVRSAMSIDTNIAEGRGRRGDREAIRFLRIAIASCYELESHLIMGRDLRFIQQPDFDALFTQLVEVRKMLYGLIKYLSNASRA